MQGAEGEGTGSVLTYVTEPEFRKQRRRSPSCNSLFLYQPYIPYACGMDSAALRNTFRTHTECIPPPMRNMGSVYHRIPKSVDTQPPLFLKE